MKNRILKNWTFIRVLYLGIGIYLISGAIMQQEWLVLVLGGYTASMGLFAFGCAAGRCFGGQCDVEPTVKTVSQVESSQ